MKDLWTLGFGLSSEQEQNKKHYERFMDIKFWCSR